MRSHLQIEVIKDYLMEMDQFQNENSTMLKSRVIIPSFSVSYRHRRRKTWKYSRWSCFGTERDKIRKQMKACKI